MAQRGRYDADSAVGFCEDCPGQPPRDCRRERNRIEDKCAPSRRENNRFVEGRERFNRRQRRKGRPGRQVQERNMTWKDANCGAALFKVNSANLEERMDQLNEMTDNMFNDITDYAADLGWSIAQERLERYALAAGGRYAATGLCAAAGGGVGALAGGVGAAPGAAAGGTVCAIGATVINVVSGIWNLFSGASAVARAGREIDQMLDTLTSVRNNAQAVLNAAEDPQALANVQSELGEAMAVAAEADPCLKARKCYLVPYDTMSQQGPSSMNQSGPGGSGFFDSGFADLSDSRGCCPGQTGHHLLPAATFGNCPGYTRSQHNRAPTVCAEGVNHSQGSHGQMHSAMDRRLTENHSNGEPMSMDQAIDHAVESLRDTVGENCREDCLKQQLEQFYNNLPCTPEPILSTGQPAGGADEEDL